MSDIIHLLPDAVANQIAAGEVIQRPASVLKELVENSIDAGATFILVVFRESGRNLLQVTDNGKGMSPADARMSFERHATSKIASANDLFKLTTMGFRGEALASIASVAQVELKTRREEDELGISVEIAGSRISQESAVQCNKGTTLIIKNLFFNVPARRRFLKSDNVEKTHLLNEFYRIVLVHPEIEFSLYEGDEEIMQLPPAKAKVRIEQVFGNARKKISQQLLSIDAETGLVTLRGFIGRPEFAQKNAQQFFFVNGRYMRHPYFHKAVMLAYNQLIPSGENPQYFIYFDVDPESIDVNIHPTKTEIKFENEQAIWSILSAAVKEVLGKFNVVPSIDFDQSDAPELLLKADPEKAVMPRTTFNPDYNPFHSSSYKRPQMEWEKLYSDFETNKNGNFPDHGIAESELEDGSSMGMAKDVFMNDFGYARTQSVSGSDGSEPFNGSKSFNGSGLYEDSGRFMDHSGAFVQEQEHVQMRIVSSDEHQGDYFQLKNRFVVTSVKSGMLLVDQRRAHIRVLFDQFRNEIAQRRGFSQQLLFPEILILDHEELDFFSHIEEDLRFMGFELEKTGKLEFEIKGIPVQLNNSTQLPKMLKDMLHKVMEESGGALDEIHDQLARQLANNAAIQSVQKLNPEEMKDLMQRLFTSPEHNYTPDGKPIMVIWTMDEILKRF